ncbi:MAG: 3,4-dihydroxy-2-butanone-4-phosphate synthase [Salinirussus sp.]
MSTTSEGRAAVEAAERAFREGRPVAIHDAADREGETDLVYPAGAVTPAEVARMRNDAGGLICVPVGDAVATQFDLPFLREEVDHPVAGGYDLAYDERSSFSLPVNHRETRTGITDRDRSRTIRALAAAAADPDGTDFAAEFRTPGHVPILRAAPELLAERRGHTEFAVALAAAADRAPAAVVCEMLDDETGEAMRPADAREYALEQGIPYVEGSTLVAALGYTGRRKS